MNGFEIISSSRLTKDLDDYLSKGAEPGRSTGFDVIDNHYTVLDAGVTDITGYPGSGKTLFLDDLLMSMSQRYGKRHLIYMPDSGNHKEIYSKLIHKVTGKTFVRNKGYTNVITREEMYAAKDWIAQHFHVVVRTDFKKRLTPFEFWDFAVKEGYDSAAIDSWNFMSHPHGGGTQYLAEVLSYRNELAESNNIHFYTIIHPKNPTEKDYNSEGKLRPANQYSLMGGSEWNNNGKNIISLHSHSKESTDYEVHFCKIKPDIVGVAGGMVDLSFDWRLRRFYSTEYDNYKGSRKQYAVETMFANKEVEIFEEQEKPNDLDYKSYQTMSNHRPDKIEDNEYDDVPF